MIPRALPPVHSPLSLGAIAHGLSGGAEALTRARSLLLQQYDSRDALLTDGGTSALALGLRLAVARRPGVRRVALPAWGCYDLATAADAADVEVVLYDLDPATLGPDQTSLDRALATGVAAVVVVHFYGVPVNLAEVAVAAARSGALTIEDAAQAIGTRLGDQPAGAVGDLGILSFGRGKGWTGGGGGALLLSRQAAADLALPPPESLADPGAGGGTMVKLTAQWLLARPACYAVPSALPFLQLGQTVYRSPSPAARMSGAEAAVLLATAPLQAPEAQGRRYRAERLGCAVAAAGASVPKGWEGGTPGWLRLPFLPNDRILQRCGAVEARRLGIWPGYPVPLSRLDGFAGRLHQPDAAYPGAEQLAGQLQTLPTHGQLMSRDLVRLEQWLERSTA